MVRVWIAGACLLLGGCEKPIVTGCEDFTKSQLKAPSTYKRLELSEFDEATTYGELVKLGMLDTEGMIDRMAKKQPDPTRMSQPENLHKILIKYEASNSYGVPLPGAEVCAFAVDKDSRGEKLYVDIYVGRARSEAESRAAINAGMRENDRRTNMDPAYHCCL